MPGNRSRTRQSEIGRDAGGAPDASTDGYRSLKPRDLSVTEKACALGVAYAKAGTVDKQQ